MFDWSEARVYNCSPNEDVGWSAKIDVGGVWWGMHTTVLLAEDLSISHLFSDVVPLTDCCHAITARAFNGDDNPMCPKCSGPILVGGMDETAHYSVPSNRVWFPLTNENVPNLSDDVFSLEQSPVRFSKTEAIERWNSLYPDPYDRLLFLQGFLGSVEDLVYDKSQPWWNSLTHLEPTREIPICV